MARDDDHKRRRRKEKKQKKRKRKRQDRSRSRSRSSDSDGSAGHARPAPHELLLAAAVGDRPRCRELIQQGADVAYADAEGTTALHEACRHGHTSAAKLLLRRGADAGLGDVRGDTPAHLAARHGHLDLLAELLQAGGRARGCLVRLAAACKGALAGGGREAEAAFACLLPTPRCPPLLTPTPCSQPARNRRRQPAGRERAAPGGARNGQAGCAGEGGHSARWLLGQLVCDA